MFLIARRAEKDDFSQKSDEDGLDLAISKRLVKLLRGDIGVNSCLGFSSCFWLLLAQWHQCLFPILLNQ